MLASPGLEEFAIQAGVYNPASGQPLRFADAFMRHAPHDAAYSHPRVRVMQQLLTGAPYASPHAAMPVFVRPPAPLLVQDVFAVMRNHYDYSPHDAYWHENPAERWRPVAVLRSGNGHVSIVRPAAAGLPDALSAIGYIATTMPLFSPFLPFYKGLGPAGGLPVELTSASAVPDPVSLFWKARRLQALVFRDWPRLAPRATAAVVAFEDDVESRLRPAMEAAYLRAAAAGRQAAADEVLVSWTAGVVRQACSLLEALAAEAAAGLGLPGVPADEQLVAWLDEAEDDYNFLPFPAAAESKKMPKAAPLGRRGSSSSSSEGSSSRVGPLARGSGGGAAATAAAA